jgi:hypothetical protein
MLTRGLPLSTAYSLVRTARPAVRPDGGKMEKLRILEQFVSR